MKKLILIFIVLIFIIMGLVGGPVKNSSDILVKLNFYEGLKGENPGSEQIVSTYYLKPLFVGKVHFVSSGENESLEIKKIFNLSGINLMSEATWGWRRGEKQKEFQVLILNGHEFLVEVTMKEMPDNFIVVVTNRQNKKILLKSNLVLPEKKSSVFGFEDSKGKPFFLSLSRAAGESILRKEASEKKIIKVKRPVLIKKTKPLYPKAARLRGISGVVKIEAVCDVYGKVEKTSLISGNPILGKAAIDALKQWVYEPYLINNKPKPVKFTVIVKFKLDDKKINRIKPDKSVVLKDKNIPDIWPAKGYLTLTFGKVRVNKKGKKIKHSGVDIAAKKGSKVIAPAKGKVVESKFYEYYGKMVILDHGNGYISKYAHLDELKVKKGEKVKKGALIGLVGSTGLSTAPHLHWEIHYKGKPIDPLTLIKE